MGQTLEYIINSPVELNVPASVVAGLLRDYPVVAFYGPMGAGKTTLIREIALCLGVRDTVTSPTFAIVNAYCDTSGFPVYHFDFYRIDNPVEALDLGAEEYFYSGFPCLIEWPEKIPALLPPGTLEIYIIPSPAFPLGRTVRMQKPG